MLPRGDDVRKQGVALLYRASPQQHDLGFGCEGIFKMLIAKGDELPPCSHGKQLLEAGEVESGEF